MIKWYGAFKVVDGKIVDKFIFPDEERVNILRELKRGNFSILSDFIGDDKILIEGEIKDRRALISTAINLAKLEMVDRLGEDYRLIETLHTYDDIISTINLLEERLLEWEKIEEIKNEEDNIQILIREEVQRLKEVRDKVSSEIERRAGIICPNLSHLVGPIIAAKLIASAGGLKRLAKLPASTIQVLGAEEAFFRHLRTGAKCPKHGIIFRVPIVRNSPKRIRGKIARTLASKIAIAARVDYYHGEFIGDKLKDELLKRVDEVKK